MNSDATHAPWQQFKTQLRKTWSALTDDDLEAICRGDDDLVRVVQLRYDGQQAMVTPSLTIVGVDLLIDENRLGLTRLQSVAAGSKPVILRKLRRAHRLIQKRRSSLGYKAQPSRRRTPTTEDLP